MTERRAHVLYSVLGVGLAIVLAIAFDADVELSLSVGLWFELAILTIVAAFLMEPQFSGGGAAAANAVAVLLVFIGADRRTHASWWIALAVAAIISLLVNFAGYIVRDPDSQRSARADRLGRVLSQIGATLGGWRSLLLASMVLALATFNRPFGPEWNVGTIVVLFCLIVSRVPPHRVLGQLRGEHTTAGALAVLVTCPPHEVLLGGDQIDDLAPGAPLRIRSKRGSCYGLVVAETLHHEAMAWRVFAPQLSEALPASGSSRVAQSLTVEVLDDCPPEFVQFHEALTGASQSQLKGLAIEGTAMREGVFEIAPGAHVSFGEVLWTSVHKGHSYWQVTDATIVRRSWGGDSRQAVTAQAIQVGRWDPDHFAFEPDLQSPDPYQLLFGGELPRVDPTGILDDRAVVVGTLPSSSFPVVVDLAKLSREHGAILGVTGTGKTHLAFKLAEGLANLGVKVICVDQTGQYARRFPAAPTLGLADVIAFLEGNDGNLALFDLGDNLPVSEVNKLARSAFEWVKKQPTLDADKPARCVLLFEEAHNYVPEAFVLNDWDLKAKVQDTSVVVMESRKHGLGFLLVSQRTAMVTKSALSQCNTIFAFQAVDQTGLDYFEGLCGRPHVRAIPTLPHRTALAMGRALRSTTPLVVLIHEAPTKIS